MSFDASDAVIHWPPFYGVALVVISLGMCGSIIFDSGAQKWRRLGSAALVLIIATVSGYLIA